MSVYMNVCLVIWVRQLFKMGSTLKRKNLLLEDQILSFRSRSLQKREAKIVELLALHLKEYPSIFIFLLHIFGSD